MKITFPIFTTLKDAVVKFITDLKYFTKSEFKDENYNKHFWYSTFLTMPFIVLLMLFFYLNDTNILFVCFIGGFGARAVNYIREGYFEWKYNAPFSITDVNFGTYGGVLGALIVGLIFKYLNY